MRASLLGVQLDDGPGLGDSHDVFQILVPLPFLLFFGQQARGTVLFQQHSMRACNMGKAEGQDIFRRGQTGQRLQHAR